MKNFIFYRSRTTIACMLILSTLVSSCVLNGVPKKIDSNTHTICCNNDVLYTDFSKPQYEVTGSPFGYVVLGANIIGGGYLGATNPFVRVNNANGTSTTSPVLSGLAMAGIGALVWFAIAGVSGLGTTRPVPFTDEDAKWWLQNVSDSLILVGKQEGSGNNIYSLTALPKSYIKNYNISGLNHAREYKRIFGKTDYETKLVISSLKQRKFKQTWTFSLGPEDNAIDLIEVFPDNDSIGMAVVRFVTDEVNAVSGCKLVADKFPKYALIAEQRAYDIASKQNTLGELQEFLKLFPNTSLRSKAEKKQTEILYNIYKQDYQACNTADDYVNFIAKHKSKDYDKLIPKAQERVKQLRYKEYKDMFANAKSGYDFGAFINKYATNDPDNLIPRAKAAEYQKLFEEAYSSSDCSSFIEKYANNDPNGYIPQVQEKRAAALVREEQERLAEAKRQEEERREQAKLQNRRWKVLLTNQQDRTSYNKYITTMGVGFTGRDEEYGSVVEDDFASNEITYDKSNNSYKIFLSGRRGAYVTFEVHYVKGILGNSWEVSGGVIPTNYYSNVFNLCRSGNISASTLTDLAIEIYINEFLRKPH